MRAVVLRVTVQNRFSGKFKGCFSGDSSRTQLKPGPYPHTTKAGAVIDDVMQHLQREAVLDSQGEFSLDLQAEAARMSLFVQQEPCLWLLKGVQAAVAAGATEVNIRLNRSRFELSFQPSLGAGPASFDSPSNWCRHLRTAVTLALAGPSQGVQLNHADHLLIGTPVASPGVCLRVLRPKRSWWQFADGELAAVARGLALRCAFSPIGIRIDGHDILSGAPEKCPLIESRQPLLNLGEGVPAVPWLGESWSLVEQGAAFCLQAPCHRPAAEVRVGSSYRLEKNDSHLFSTPVSCLSWLRTPLQVRRLKAQEDGDWVGRINLLDRISSGALLQLSSPEVLGLGFRLGFRQEHHRRVEEFVLADVLAEQLLPGSGKLKKLRFPLARLHSWTGLCSSGQAPGGLFLINDGVLLNPIRGWSAYAGTTALVATSGQATDLSQLNPVQEDTLNSLVQQAQQDEAELAQDLKDSITSPAQCERLQVPLATREHWRKLL